MRSTNGLPTGSSQCCALSPTGHPNKQIAWRLELSTDTIKAHLKNIFAKLGVDDRTHAVTEATIRAHMAEFGIVAPVGRGGVDRLLQIIEDEADERVPVAARQCLQMLVAQLKLVKRQILENDRQVLALTRSSELEGRRLGGLRSDGFQEMNRS
jgi:DNA-binding CsgD family transcriptional regulator